jgi:hypothetical protein
MAGRHWYKQARTSCRRLARAYDEELETVVGIAAALSPGTPWKRNLISTHGVLEDTWDQSRFYHTFGNGNLQKAWAIRLRQEPLEVLGGHKVRGFYRSILLQDGAVADDAWMYDVNDLGYSSTTPPKGHYEACKESVKMIASREDMKTYQVQAIIWIQAKKEAGSPGHETDPTLVPKLLRMSDNDKLNLRTS